MTNEAKHGLTANNFDGVIQSAFGNCKGSGEVMLLKLYFENEKRLAKTSAFESALSKFRDTYAAALIDKLREAIQTGNGQYFRELGKAIEIQALQFGENPLRVWLHWWLLTTPERPITAAELVEQYQQETGNSVDGRHLRRVCAELRIPLKRAKSGPQSRTK